MLGARAASRQKRNSFTSNWDTTQAGGSANDSVDLSYSNNPMVSNGSYNFKVYWGDGTTDIITTHNQAETLHQYASTGIYESRIGGEISGWYFNQGGDDDKIIEISNWGPLRFRKTPAYDESIFAGCSNLKSSATDSLTLDGNNGNSMFEGCDKLGDEGNMNSWDTSNVTSMHQMFYSTSGFNQPVGAWDTSSCTNMSQMFRRYAGEMTFDQDIGAWDVSNVTNMTTLFAADGYGTNVFNNGGSSSISGWDTSSVTDMSYMFQNCTGFNQPIGNWDTSKVTNMYFMLRSCNSFNQDLGGWDMTGVTDLYGFFGGCSSFNNGGSTGINNWRTSSCTDMYQMFYNISGFNQPIGAWDTSSCTNMSQMFRRYDGGMTFDQDIGAWDVSNVTNMFMMFAADGGGVNAFNNGGSSSISGWNTSSLTNIQSMFRACSSFDQPLTNWIVTGITSATSFMQSAND